MCCSGRDNNSVYGICHILAEEFLWAFSECDFPKTALIYPKFVIRNRVVWNTAPHILLVRKTYPKYKRRTFFDTWKLQPKTETLNVPKVLNPQILDFEAYIPVSRVRYAVITDGRELAVQFQAEIQRRRLLRFFFL